MAAQKQMMDKLERNKALVRQAYDEIINGHSTENVRAFVAETAVDHSIFGETNSADEVIRSYEEINRAFPDGHFEILDIIAEGDKVVTRSVYSGTHKGDFAGIPATGKKFSIVQIDIFRIEGDKLVEHWDAADTSSMYQQLGLSD